MIPARKSVLLQSPLSLLLATFCLALALAFAFAFALPAAAQPSASTAFVPVSRLGSRVNLFLRPDLGAAYTGGLGFDFDQPQEIGRAHV